MPKHKVGVLFVHGIGEQPEGETLLAFGEPLVRWIDDWLRRAEDGPRGEVEVSATKFAPSKTGGAFPPHAEVHVSVRGEAGAQESSWLLAESWWGGEIQPPPFGKVAGWMLTAGAWSILTHATKRAQSSKTDTRRLLREILALIVWLPLSILLQVSVLLLSLLALLPIPFVRNALSGVLLAITGVLGDSFVLVESDLQRSAIVSKTRATLRWLARRCETVVVVAHSQGAAVAHHVLRDPEPRNVATLLTFGSGLAKLEELQQIRGNRPAARFVPLLFLAVALIVYRGLVQGRDELANFGLMFLGTLLLFAFMLVYYSIRDHWNHFSDLTERLDLTSDRPNIRWWDVYSTHDVVPNGSLGALPRYESFEVVNFRSRVSDHTSYWLNRCGFIPIVVRAIADAASLTIIGPRQEERLKQGDAAHRRAVWCSIIVGWATWLAAALLFVLYWDTLFAQGTKLWKVLERLNLTDVVLKFSRALAVLIPSLSTRTAGDTALRLTGAAVPLIGIFVYRLAYGPLWRWWDASALRVAMQPNERTKIDRRTIDAFVVLAGLLPLALVPAWPYVLRVPIGYTIGAVALGLYGVFFLVALVRFGARLIEALRGKIPRSQLWVEARTLGAVVGMVFVVFVFAVPAWKGVRTVLITAMAALMLLALVCLWHRGLIGRVRAARPRYRWIAVALPPALAIAFGWLWFWSGAADKTWQEVPFEIAGFYVFAVLLSEGLLWPLTRRKLDRNGGGLSEIAPGD